MQRRIISTVEHATRRTDLFRTTRQQKGQRLKSQGRRKTNILFLNAPVFSLYVNPFIRLIFSLNTSMPEQVKRPNPWRKMMMMMIFPHVCYLDENFREYFQSNIPVHRLRNQRTWHVVSKFDARGLRAPKFQNFTLPSLGVVNLTAKCTYICVTGTRLKPSVLCCSLNARSVYALPYHSV